VVPAVVARRRSQRGLAVAVGTAWALLPAGLLLAPQAWPVWAVVGGVAQGAGISLAFTLVVLRSADEATARRLSGMSQLVGYTAGAAGPLVVGALYAATGGWTVPLLLLVAAAVALAGAGVAAGSPAAIMR
jgi:CP family cyanate transporter-like MFS transporter